MSEVEDEIEQAEPQPIMLDPFSFHAGVASKVAGLGGSAPGYDPTYVFHTPYVEAAAGPAQFTLRFAGLEGKTGTLVLRVNMLPMEEGAAARLANSDRIHINRLIRQNGETSIRFEGYRGVSFALYGTIIEDTDAVATGLDVMLDRPADANEEVIATEAKTSEFGQDIVRPVGQMIALKKPVLALPVSQYCTAGQLVEPIFAEWQARLGPGGSSADRWSILFVAQTLTRYGMVQPGARGLGIDFAAGPLPAFMAGEGVEILATGEAGDEDEPDDWAAARFSALARPALCTPETFDQRVTVRSVSPRRLARDLVNFDFVWSIGAIDRLGSVDRGIGFVEQSMLALRPGGLAVHVFAFDADPFGETISVDGRVLWKQRDVDRLALILISRSYEVAQIKIGEKPFGDLIDVGARDPQLISAFGLIVRRPASAY